MWIKIKLFLLLAVISSNGDSDPKPLKPSFVIVLDVSESMRDDIEIFRAHLKQLVDNVYRWSGDSFGNYILVQFNEQDVIETFKNTSYVNLKNVLDVLYINRRNRDVSCTASCYQGLRRGLKLANNDSVLLVFTDAGTDHKELHNEIEELLQLKRVSLYFTLTEGCEWENPVEDYRNLVSVYNGDVFNVDPISSKKHFELLAQIVSGPPAVPSAEVIVDSTMNEFVLTVSGRNSVVTIFGPDHKYVPSARYKMLTDTLNVKMIVVQDPIPGRYTVEIVSETQYTGQVQTKSDLQFKYGFSVNEPSSMAQTMYAPLKGHDTYLAISPSDATLIDNLDYVLLNDGQEHYALQKVITKDEVFFITKSITIPSKPFNIQVNGMDRKKFRILRLISPSIFAVSPERPIVDVERNIVVQEGDPINLNCRVQSAINVTIEWSKTGLKSSLKFSKFQQSDASNYKIGKAQISDSGEYICTAINNVGSVRSNCRVSVKQTRLFVNTTVKSIEVKAGMQKLVLECHVLPLNVKVSWLFNGKPVVSQESQYNQSNLILFDIKPNYTGQYTCLGQKGAEQKRDHTRLKVLYPPNILNLYNTNTNTTIDSIGPLTISDKIASLQIMCQYESYPNSSVQWVSPTGNRISKNAILNLHHPIKPGEYRCEVENNMGKVGRDIEIIVLPFESSTTPISTTERTVEIELIDDAGTRKLSHNEHEFEIINQTRITAICKIEGSSAIWKKDGIIVSTTNNLTITPLQSLNISGLYECITETDFPYGITFKQIIKPKTIELYNDNIELNLGAQFSLKCPLNDGNYNVTWLLNGENLDTYKMSDGSLYIDSVELNMSGRAHCIGTNKAGSASASFKFNLLRPPYDLIGNTSTGKSPILNEKYEIACSAKGQPEPNVYWTKDEKYFSLGNSVHFENFRPSNNGIYTCIAVNDLGIANTTFTVKFEKRLHSVELPSGKPNNCVALRPKMIYFIPALQTLVCIMMRGFR